MVRVRFEKRVIAQYEWTVACTLAVFCGIGLLLLHSAGFSHDLSFSPPLRRQAISMGVGACAFFIAMLVRTSLWKRTAYLVYLVGVVLLVAILFHGVVAGGAKRWLHIGSLRLQPSEFMKVGAILALAKLFSSENAPRDGYTFFTLLLPCGMLLIPVLLVAVEPDLGTALCIALIGGSMLALMGIRKNTVIRLGGIALLMLVPAWSFLLKDYQRQRILTFLSPESDPLGSGYHAIQSKIAVGSGMFTGKGFLQGTQSQLSFLPEQTTDFIFSVLAEEWGFIGSVFVLALYWFLILRLLRIASRHTDRFSAFVAVGVAALIFWHVVVNIGMVIGVLPVVGLTLPLISYGGSSLVTIMLALGIVAGSTARRSF